MRYNIQKIAPAGNWVNLLGTDSFQTATQHLKGYFEMNPLENYRLVCSVDVVLDPELGEPLGIIGLCPMDSGSQTRLEEFIEGSPDEDGDWYQTS